MLSQKEITSMKYVKNTLFLLLKKSTRKYLSYYSNI